MSGFVPMQASWWETIRETLPKPWPMEAAAMDLRWHLDRATARDGWAPIRFPGRPSLAADWGWSDWDARTLMRNEGLWKDALASAVPSNAPPARLQRAASRDNSERRQSAKSLQRASNAPPTRLQQSSTRALLLTHHTSPRG